MTTKEKIMKEYTPKGLAMQGRRGGISTFHGDIPVPVKWSEKKV